jgi:hypothetical protein
MASHESEGAYAAALWEHPNLCLALFGVQYLTEEGQRLYEESGVNDEIFPALMESQSDGLLLNRPMMTDEGPVLMQYWRSHDDLERFSRRLPHTAWWKWLMENHGKGVGFYHEVYQVKAAEAIFETGTRPVGPATFCSRVSTKAGEGRSSERQRRFQDAAGGNR